MEKFRGRAHLPGTDGPWELELEIDWETREVSVHVDQAPGGLSDWPGLAVQTFGPADEVSFRTKGIPRLFTHWWHLVRGGGGLWGMVLGLPDAEGTWHTCTLSLQRVE